MTDDRSLERAARSFIEPGPTRAPEAAVERALDVIQTTRQERDLRILRRFSTMTTTTRVAVAAVVGVIAIGGTAFLLRPTAPDAATRPPASASPIATPSAATSTVVAFLQATIARENEEVAGLEAIQPPAALTTEHLANIQTVKDVNALLNHEIDLIQANPPKLVEAAAVDDATTSLNTLREQFATKYALPPCP